MSFSCILPIQWTQPPTHVLLLGGGDGIVAKELLKYESVQSITLVDLDPVMLELARHHPVLRRINNNSFWDHRVRLINADAFCWLRNSKKKYDAIYIDMPDPDTYELSKLYSVEFYSMVRRRLFESGFIAADVPYSEPYDWFYIWRQYYSTFHAAGFKQIRRFATIVELDNPALRQYEKEWVEEHENQGRDESIGLVTEKDREVLRKQFRNLVNKIVYGMNQGFVFLRWEESPIRTTFQDYGIPLYVFNEERFRLSSHFNYPETYSPRAVNSIFHPTFPRSSWPPNLPPLIRNFFPRTQPGSQTQANRSTGDRNRETGADRDSNQKSGLEKGARYHTDPQERTTMPDFTTSHTIKIREHLGLPKCARCQSEE